MKRYDVCGLGNAIVDIFLFVSEPEFRDLGFQRGSMELVDEATQEKLLSEFGESRQDLELVSGGSVANSIIAVSQLGGKAAYIGCVGNDRYGLHYADEFKQLQIEMGNPILPGQSTGTCLAIITPDGERTMRTFLGVASQLAAKHIEADRVTASKWLFVEGYLFANPETGQHAIREAMHVAKANGTKVALTCSDAFVPEIFKDAFLEALAESDLLFCNAAESLAVTGTTCVDEAFGQLQKIVPNCVVTHGSHGAHVYYGGKVGHVPTQPCQPRDLTGAGDMFAGSFLYGITHGFDPLVAAKTANALSRRVIMQVGARLRQDVASHWEEAARSG